MFPGEAAEQDSDVLALLCREGKLDRTMKVIGLVKAGDPTQAHAFCGQSLFDFSVPLNLDEIRRHVSSRRSPGYYAVFSFSFEPILMKFGLP